LKLESAEFAAVPTSCWNPALRSIRADGHGLVITTAAVATISALVAASAPVASPTILVAASALLAGGAGNHPVRGRAVGTPKRLPEVRDSGNTAESNQHQQECVLKLIGAAFLTPQALP